MRTHEHVHTRRGALRAAAAIGIVLFACTKGDEPKDPVWGKEPCAHCRMLVGDRRVAAQVFHDGERRYFDDPGCMILWLEENHLTLGKADVRGWVRDADGGDRWLDARTARYRGGATTPMDFGFDAHANDPPGATGMLAFEQVRASVIAKRGADAK